MSHPDKTLIATSLKMYLDHDQTVDWAHRVRDIAATSPAAHDGSAELVVFPSYPSLPDLAQILSDVPVALGAQNMAAEASGAFTGEVSPASLRQVGCTYVEIGHAERRRHFAETPADVRKKIALALEHGLRPLLCLGEQERSSPANAAATCIAQIEAATSLVPRNSALDLVLAYEPEWAIGAQDAAEPSHIRDVATRINSWTQQQNYNSARIIYGGSAKPGLLADLGPQVSGLFLGRFAHDAQALATILDEAQQQHRLDATTG